MKRPALVIAVNVIHLLLALGLAGLSIYLLILTRAPETLKEPDAADTIHGLLIGAGVLGIPSVLLFFGAWGLWKNRLWGWWLAMLSDVGMLATLAYSVVGENSVDWDDLALTLCFAVCPILLLLPRVRKYFWGDRESQPSTIVETS